MDVKDQRLEIRIPQQQLDELDAIRVSAGSPYPLTRSDVARMFIAQGIERHNQGEAQASIVQRDVSLGERLAIFFQLAIPRPSGVYQDPRVSQNRDHNYPPIGDLNLVENIYKKRFFWFFEIDKKTLELMSGPFRFQSDAVQSLFDRQPNIKICQNLQYVCKVVRMYARIKKCLDNADFRDGLAESVKKYSQRKGVPLDFPGFPGSAPELNEMAAVVQWMDEDNSNRTVRAIDCDQDFTAVFDKLLAVYHDLVKSNGELDLETLHDIIVDPRIV